MKIIKAKDAQHIDKPEGTAVDYYLFKDYEVHYNEQAPYTSQTWHHHEMIWETLYIIDGELIARWRDGDSEEFEILHKGDLVETERTPHTFSNEGEKPVRFLVIKRMPANEDFSEVFKSDKVLD